MMKLAVRIRRLRHAEVGADSGFAMLMALFVIGVIATVSLSIAGVMLAEIQPSQHDAKSSRTVEAAEGGFDTAQNAIREATTDGSTGKKAMLPCAVNGSVGGTKLGSATTFTVAVAYYSADPTAHLTNSASDVSWRSAHKLTCTPGSGTATTPSYAILTSAGVGTALPGSAASVGNRKLQAVFQLPTTNVHIPGGPLRAYGATTLCMDGADGSGKVAAGNTVYIRTCDASSQGQKFSYTKELFLQLVSTVDNTTKFCVDVAATGGTTAKLANCDASKPTQLWSYTGGRNFVASNSTESDVMGQFCLATSVSPPSSGSVVQVHDAGANNSCPWAMGTSWQPDPSVGAGAAGTPFTGADGATQDQLVNYQYFGNCLDITNEQPSWSFLIGYPCKQNPNKVKLDWNQLWTYNSSSKHYYSYYYDNNGVKYSYCLQAGTNSQPPTAGTLVLTPTCNSGETFEQWVPSGSIAGDYADSYRIYLAANPSLCLQLTQPGPAHLGTPDNENASLQPWGYISVENCNSATNQKWNAPPSIPEQQLLNTYEQANG